MFVLMQASLWLYILYSDKLESDTSVNYRRYMLTDVWLQPKGSYNDKYLKAKTETSLKNCKIFFTGLILINVSEMHKLSGNKLLQLNSSRANLKMQNGVFRNCSFSN